MMEHSELSYEEKLVDLGKRTGLEVPLLKQLPEERLSDYFSRTAELGLHPAWLGAAAVSAAIGGAAMVTVPGAGLSAFGLLSGAVANAALCYFDFRKIENNEKASAEIQKELADSLKTAHQVPPAVK